MTAFKYSLVSSPYKVPGYATYLPLNQKPPTKPISTN